MDQLVAKVNNNFDFSKSVACGLIFERLLGCNTSKQKPFMKRIFFSLLLTLAVSLGCWAQNAVNAMVDIEGIAGGGSLPKPSYKSRETGIVVVKVVVNSQGKVIEAMPGYTGSDTTDPTLCAAAKEAALKARFKMADVLGGNCTGTITYGFGVELSTDNVQGKGVDPDGFISIADLLDYHEDGEYCVRAAIFGFADEEALIFYVQQREDEILPVQLAPSVDAAATYNSLKDLPQGAPIEVKGTLSKLVFGEETLKALVNAEVLSATSNEVVEVERRTLADDPSIIPPKFKGKDANHFSQWVTKRLVYPPKAKKYYIEGTVLISFTINKSGDVVNVKVVKSVYPELDKEAVRVVSMSPKWTPALKDGEPVNVTYTYPVIFALGY